MNIQFQKSFEKGYKKLSSKLQARIKERNVLFIEDPFNPVLNNHALKGRSTRYRSINVSGDIRIIYKFLEKDTALFCSIGTHSTLYT